MSEAQEFTYSEVSSHTSKKDLFIVVHDKVYNATNFIDEHPGGEEVLLDVGGQDATEAFEDVGHSDEARETLDTMIVGNLKRMPGDPPRKQQPPTSTTSTPGQESAGLGVGLYALVFLGAALAFGAYKYLQTSAGSQEVK